MKKCRYCGKKVGISLEFCCGECENSYRKSIKEMVAEAFRKVLSEKSSRHSLLRI